MLTDFEVLDWNALVEKNINICAILLPTQYILELLNLINQFDTVSDSIRVKRLEYMRTLTVICEMKAAERTLKMSDGWVKHNLDEALQ